MNESVSKTVEKPWGWYTTLYQGPGYLVKVLLVKENQSISLQSHQHRSEEWFVLEGAGIVEINGATHIADKGFSFAIKAGEKHRLSAPMGSDIRILEIQTGEILDENDIERFADQYGRT